MKNIPLPTKAIYEKEDYEKLVNLIESQQEELEKERKKSNLLEQQLINFNSALDQAFDITGVDNISHLKILQNNYPINFQVDMSASFSDKKPRLRILINNK